MSKINDFQSALEDLKPLDNLVAVIDIGSNSVRIVINQAPDLDKPPKFEHREKCKLASSIEETGFLDPDAKIKVLELLSTYAEILNDCNIQELRVIGTAPFRDAEDGNLFARQIRKQTGLPIEIISGEQEAIYAASGVAQYYPDATGVTADLGGGSIDIACLRNGKIENAEQDTISLPIGVIKIKEVGDAAANIAFKDTFLELSGKSIDELGSDIEIKKIKKIIGQAKEAAKTARTAAMKDYIDRNIETIPEHFSEQNTLYPVGGTWRNISKSFAKQSGFEITAESEECAILSEAFSDYADTLTQAKRKKLLGKFDISEKRIDLIEPAALLFEALTNRLGLENTVLTRATMRDGVFDEIVESRNWNDQDPELKDTPEAVAA